MEKLKNKVKELGFEMGVGAEAEVHSAWERLKDLLNVGRVGAEDLEAFFCARTKSGVSEILADENLGFAVLAQINRGFARGVIFETFNRVTGRRHARYALLSRFFDRFFLLPLWDFVESESLRRFSGEEVIEEFFHRPRRWMVDQEGEIMFLPIPEEFAPLTEVAGNFVRIGAKGDLTLFDFEKGEEIQPPAGSVFFAFRLTEKCDLALLRGREILSEKMRIFRRTSERLKVVAAVKFLHENSTWVKLNHNFETSLERRERLLLAVSASAKTGCGMYQADWGRRIEIQTSIPREVFEAIPNSIFVHKVYKQIDRELSRKTLEPHNVTSFVLRAVDLILLKVEDEVEKIKKRVRSLERQGVASAVMA